MARFSIDSINKDRPPTLELEIGDHVVICFKPAAAYEGYKSFTVSTLFLSTDRLALQVFFDESFEDNEGTHYILDETTGADELLITLRDQQVRLKRVVGQDISSSL